MSSTDHGKKKNKKKIHRTFYTLHKERHIPALLENSGYDNYDKSETI